MIQNAYHNTLSQFHYSTTWSRLRIPITPVTLESLRVFSTTTNIVVVVILGYILYLLDTVGRTGFPATLGHTDTGPWHYTHHGGSYRGTSTGFHSNLWGMCRMIQTNITINKHINNNWQISLSFWHGLDFFIMKLYNARRQSHEPVTMTLNFVIALND